MCKLSNGFAWQPDIFRRKGKQWQLIFILNGENSRENVKTAYDQSNYALIKNKNLCAKVILQHVHLQAVLGQAWSHATEKKNVYTLFTI